MHNLFIAYKAYINHIYAVRYRIGYVSGLHFERILDCCSRFVVVVVVLLQYTCYYSVLLFALV
jgi:hypothetical protein